MSARKGSKLSEETKEKIRQKMQGMNNHFWGKHHTKKSRKKISETGKGRPSFWKGKKRPDREGEKHPCWKGEKAGYVALHMWIYKILGKPTKCEHCEKDGLSGKKINWANISGNYSRDKSDWIRLCPKCHKKFDNNKKTYVNYSHKTSNEMPLAL